MGVTWVVTADETRVAPAIRALRAAGADVVVRPDLASADAHALDAVLVDVLVAARGLPPLPPAVTILVLVLPGDVPVPPPADVGGVFVLAPGAEDWLPALLQHARTKRASSHAWMRPLVHDIRGALMTVSGFSDALSASPALPATERTYAEHLARAAARLQATVAVAAELVRVTTGRAQVARAEVPVSSIVEGVEAGTMNTEPERARWLVAWAHRSLGGRADVTVERASHAVSFTFRRAGLAPGGTLLRDELEQHLAAANARLLGVVMEDHADDAVGPAHITLRFPA